MFTLHPFTKLTPHHSYILPPHNMYISVFAITLSFFFLFTTALPIPLHTTNTQPLPGLPLSLAVPKSPSEKTVWKGVDVGCAKL
jgi:hypothetical protein